MMKSLLYRERLRYMGNYEFRVDQNHIDIDNFKSLCYEVLSTNKVVIALLLTWEKLGQEWYFSVKYSPSS